MFGRCGSVRRLLCGGVFLPASDWVCLPPAIRASKCSRCAFPASASPPAAACTLGALLPDVIASFVLCVIARWAFAAVSNYAEKAWMWIMQDVRVSLSCVLALCELLRVALPCLLPRKALSAALP